MAVPMFFGIAAVILFSVVDTYFVGQIGEAELAAMGFCFPVAFFVQNIAEPKQIRCLSYASTWCPGSWESDFSSFRWWEIAPFALPATPGPRPPL